MEGSGIEDLSRYVENTGTSLVLRTLLGGVLRFVRSTLRAKSL